MDSRVDDQHLDFILRHLDVEFDIYTGDWNVKHLCDLREEITYTLACGRPDRHRDDKHCLYFYKQDEDMATRRKGLYITAAPAPVNGHFACKDMYKEWPFILLEAAGCTCHAFPKESAPPATPRNKSTFQRCGDGGLTPTRTQLEQPPATIPHGKAPSRIRTPPPSPTHPSCSSPPSTKRKADDPTVSSTTSSSSNNNNKKIRTTEPEVLHPPKTAAKRKLDMGTEEQG